VPGERQIARNGQDFEVSIIAKRNCRMTDDRTPLVSLALPVYNGENFVAEALESVRNQTFTDYELIIADNASTDGTEEICRAFMADDPRIRYYRNEKNLGAAPNFNLSFRYASGRYFKWVSHDDTMEPEFLAKAVAALEANPDAVLVHSLIKLIDVDGNTLDIHDTGLDGVESAQASKRFGIGALKPHQVLDLDGLLRSDALAKTEGIRSYPGGDRTLYCEVALCGPILKINEPLFMTREHPGRYRVVSGTKAEARIAFYDTRKAEKKGVWTWHQYKDYWHMVRRHVHSRGERLRCAGHLLRWWFVNWNSARLAVDIVALVAPGILISAERFKQAVISPQPGPNPGAPNNST
jgi:glycosyltransferase involved in cell wall biosynthesis